MSFYTSVNRYGNTIFYRGYNDSGNPIEQKIPFKPTLYINSNGSKSDWISLNGTPVKPVEFAKMSDAKEFVDKYKDIEQFKVYGQTNYIMQYITKKFPNEIKWNPKHINVVNFDIEVQSDEGFPEPVAKPNIQLYPLLSSPARVLCIMCGVLMTMITPKQKSTCVVI